MAFFRFLLGSTVVVAVAVYVAVQLGGYELRQARETITALEHDKQELIEYATKLTSSRRVAQVDVLKQRTDEDGRTITTLMFQEIGPDGVVGRPLAVETIGELVYFEALVIKFRAELARDDDDVRSMSIASFRRVFGEQQTAVTGAMLDTHASPVGEALAASTDAEAGPLTQDQLWGRFWELVNNPQLADQLGVRVAQVEAPAAPMKPGEVWEVSLDTAGGLNLRKVASRPSGDGHVVHYDS